MFFLFWIYCLILLLNYNVKLYIFMLKTILKVFGNGALYGVYAFLFCFLMGYFVLPFNTLLSYSIPIALCAMIINGAMYSRFTKPVKVLEKIVINTNNSETLIIQSPANHLIDNDIVSRKLCLTDQRLLFKSHSDQEFEWNKSELHSLNSYPSFKNKGGEFTLKNEENRRLMFEVDEIKAWKNELNRIYNQ